MVTRLTWFPASYPQLTHKPPGPPIRQSCPKRFLLLHMWSYPQFGMPPGPRSYPLFLPYTMLHPTPASRRQLRSGWPQRDRPTHLASLQSSILPPFRSSIPRPVPPLPTGSETMYGTFHEKRHFPEAPRWSAPPLPTGSDRFFRTFHEKPPFSPDPPDGHTPPPDGAYPMTLLQLRLSPHGLAQPPWASDPRAHFAHLTTVPAPGAPQRYLL